MNCRFICSKAIFSIVLLLVTGCASLPSSRTIVQKSAQLNKDPRVYQSGEPLSPTESLQLLENTISAYSDRDRLRQHLRYEKTVSRRPIVAGNRLELLVDGPDAYNAMFAQVKQAKHHVHMETFIFADDTVGNQLKDILLTLLEKGVQIRIIYDSYGSITTPDSFFDELRNRGALIHKFHPLNPLENPQFWKINHRDHRKLLIVDGKVAFTGGMNVSDVYSRSSFTAPLKPRDVDNRWRDTHLQLNGPIVADIQELFLETWTRVYNEEQQEFGVSDYFPYLSATGDHLVRIISGRGGDARYVLYRILLSAVSHAQDKVWITQGYFAPNQHFVEALLEAAERGVDVRLLLPGFTDSWMTLNASRAHYTELLKAGVNLFRRTDALLHAKSIIVDGVWSSVGSANLDSRSFIHNDEANAVVYGDDFGNQMEELFLFDQAHTDPITLTEWKKRPIKLKIMEKIAVLFDYWF